MQPWDWIKRLVKFKARIAVKTQVLAPSRQMDRAVEIVTERQRQWWSEQTNRHTKSDKQNKLIRPDGWLDGWRQTGQSSRRDRSTVTLWHQGGSRAPKRIFSSVNIHLDSFTFDSNALPLLLRRQQANTFHNRRHQKRQRRFVSGTAQTFRREDSASHLWWIYKRSNIRSQELMRQRWRRAQMKGEIMEKVTGGLLCNTQTDWLWIPTKVWISANAARLQGAAVFAKTARRKKNLNVFEMASIS